MSLHTQKAPKGFCQCGCGRKTDLAPWNVKRNGWVAGQPKRFIHGHNPTSGFLKHGHGSIFRRNPTYVSWVAMKYRCTNPHHKAYGRYSSLPLPICERWQKFENFLADMGERPAGRTLGRINNEKGYSKENCRWETLAEQAVNRRSPRPESYPRKVARDRKRKRIGPLLRNGNFFTSFAYTRQWRMRKKKVAQQ